MRSPLRSLCGLLPVILAVGACGDATEAETPATTSAGSSAVTAESADLQGFPTTKFADLHEEPVSGELAAELQQVLEASADGAGLTATLITPQGTWSGATGMAAGDRAMRPDDQMSIASITKTVVAAQVMRLVEAGELNLRDPAADHLPPDLDFDTNGATILDLLSMRSGYPETLDDEATWERLLTDPRRTWTVEEVLATVAPERGAVGRTFEYRGVNYLLLGLIVERITDRPLSEALRSGVLDGDGFERLISQPDERPAEPMAMPNGASSDTFVPGGGSLPTLAAASALYADANMAADSLSLARWFRDLCAGQVVTAASLAEMTDFGERPEYGLGLMDRRAEYGQEPALGHTGALFGYTSVALCFLEAGIVVVVLANAEHDVDTLAGNLVQAART